MRAKAEKPIDRTCIACGKSFTIAPSRLRNNPTQGRWCSMTCRSANGGWHSCKGNYRTGVTDKQIATEYQSGMSVAELATKYDVSIQPIYDALQRLNIERRYDGVLRRSPEDRQKLIDASRQRFTENNPRKRNDLPSDAICEAYKNGQSSARIAAQYKCDPEAIIDRVRAAGIPIRPPGYVSRVTCADGHIADSQWEADVDNWLSSRSIVHAIHPIVPWHTSGQGRGHVQHSDFKVDDTYIEVWGIQSNARYDRRREYKTDQYLACGAKLIQIFPHHMIDQDFSPLEVLISYGVPA